MEFRRVLFRSDLVLAPTSLVGRDEALNDCPHAVDFQRSSIVHATFGKGNHVCPGAQLARTELRITIEEWLKVIPEFEMAAGSRIAFQGGVVGTMDTLQLEWPLRSEEHTSELQSLMRISYDAFCLKKK